MFSESVVCKVIIIQWLSILGIRLNTHKLYETVILETSYYHFLHCVLGSQTVCWHENCLEGLLRDK